MNKLRKGISEILHKSLWRMDFAKINFFIYKHNQLVMKVCVDEVRSIPAKPKKMFHKTSDNDIRMVLLFALNFNI